MIQISIALTLKSDCTRTLFPTPKNEKGKSVLLGNLGKHGSTMEEELPTCKGLLLGSLGVEGILFGFASGHGKPGGSL